MRKLHFAIPPRTRVVLAAMMVLSVSLVAPPVHAQISNDTRLAAQAFLDDGAQSRQAKAAPTGDAAVFAPPAPQWDLQSSDGTLQGAMARWGKQAGWRVVWQDAPAVPITSSRSLSQGDFLEAAKYVITQAREAGYPIAATAYRDSTIVFRAAPLSSVPAMNTVAAVSAREPSADAPTSPANAVPVKAHVTDAAVLPVAVSGAAAQVTKVPLPVPSPAAAAVARWAMKEGQPVHLALKEWAAREGWALLWYPEVSWKVIADVDLGPQADVAAAVADVISILREEGKPLELRISEGNRVMEVLSTDVRND